MPLLALSLPIPFSPPPRFLAVPLPHHPAPNSAALDDLNFAHLDASIVSLSGVELAAVLTMLGASFVFSMG